MSAPTPPHPTSLFRVVCGWVPGCRELTTIAELTTTLLQPREKNTLKQQNNTDGTYDSKITPGIDATSSQLVLGRDQEGNKEFLVLFALEQFCRRRRKTQTRPKLLTGTILTIATISVVIIETANKHSPASKYNNETLVNHFTLNRVFQFKPSYKIKLECQDFKLEIVFEMLRKFTNAPYELQTLDRPNLPCV